VWGTSRTPEKVEGALRLGLSEGWVVREGDNAWARELLAQTQGRGVDVILDLVGAPYLESNLSVLAPQARWLVVGVSGGAQGKIDLRRLMSQRARILGTVLRARDPEERAALARAFERRVVPQFDQGRLTPVVESVLPWQEAAEAHRRLERNDTFGKILLDWSDSTLLSGGGEEGRVGGAPAPSP